jgi:hypothetical protein
VAGTLPHTEWNSQRICSLPLFPDMTLEDVDDVVDAIKAVLIQMNAIEHDVGGDPRFQRGGQPGRTDPALPGRLPPGPAF